MKITMFGATGPTGKHFTALALKNGHEVTALVRDASKLSAADKLSIVVGDATDEKAVKRVVDGADVVVSCLGIQPGGDPSIMSTAFTNILAASRQQKTPPRFVCMTTMGVGGTSFHIKLVLKLFVAGIKQIDDYERADKLVRRNGDVPYVVVRAAHLMDSPGTDAYKHSLKGFYHIAMKIPRADVATFLLRAASSAEFENKAVQLYM